jgi:large subunit ribosomal protein L18e
LLDRSSALKALSKLSSEEGVWRVAEEALRGPRRHMAAVNVGKLNRVASEGSLILVPGKVLGTGEVTKKLRVGALSFSAEGSRKIKEAGGEALRLTEFVKKYGKSGGVQVYGSR